MKKLLIIAIGAILATVACKDENGENPLVILPDVTITAPGQIYPEKTYAFTATLSAPASDNVTIKVSNDNLQILTVAADEIKIAKGETSGNVAFTTKKKAGMARIAFTSSDATVKTPELTINVPIIEVSFDNYPHFEEGTFSAVSKIVIGDAIISSSAADSPEGKNKRLAGHDDYEIGAVSDNFKAMAIPLTEGVAYTIYYDNFTADDGVEMAVALYIDWNADGDFKDQGEEIKVEKGILANAKKEVSGTISIPANAVASSRARLICYRVEGNNIQSGEGNAQSGSMLEFVYAK